MGEYADMEIDRWIGDCNWGSRRRVASAPRIPKCKCCGHPGAGYNLRGQLMEANNTIHRCPMPAGPPRLDCK
jgi:hypothetical protein